MTIQGIDLKSLRQCCFCKGWYDRLGVCLPPEPPMPLAQISHGSCDACTAQKIKEHHERMAQDSIRLMEGLAA